MLKLNIKSKNFVIRLIMFCIISLVLFCSLFFYSSIENSINNILYPKSFLNLSDNFRIHFIDVGQGDAIFIELCDGKNMLVDAGPHSNKSNLVFYLKQVLETRQNKKIDYFVLSHTDEDHVGGATAIFDNFEVECLYRPNVYTNEEIIEYGYENAKISDNSYYDSVIEKMHQEKGCNNITIFACENLFNLNNECGYKVNFLAPLDESSSSSNDLSSVIMIEYSGKKILLTGDISDYIEKRLVNLYGEYLNVDILKVAHHGSSSSTCSEFVDKTNPQFSVISLQKNNKYNFPSDEVVSRLSSSQILRTDEKGNIIFGIENNQISFVCQKHFLLNIYINYWCIVVFVESLSFVLIFFINVKQK